MKRSSIALVGLLAAASIAVFPAAGAPHQTPKRGGTVVVALLTPEPACLNYLLGALCGPGTAGGSLSAVTSAVLEAPYDTGSGYSWRPRLVSSVDVRKKRPFALTYHIRPEARWSDGVPVTARDFEFTLRALRRLDPRGDREFHKDIRSIRRVDAKTVRLVLRPRFADWRGYFENVLPWHALRGVDLSKVWTDSIDDPKTGAPIGSGPFLVEDWSRGQQLVLRRNPKYWGPHPAHVERLVVRFGVDGNDLAGWFRQGELDVAYGFTPPFLPELRRAGLPISTAPGAGWDHLAIRLGPGGHPALRNTKPSNKLIRRALAFGIDRVALARQLFADVDPTTRASQSAVYLNRSPWYEPNWSGYSFQPNRARRLLDQAGCVRGLDGIYTCGGVRLSVRIFSPTVSGSLRARALEIVRPQLRQVGIELIPVFFTSRALFDEVLSSGQFEVAIFGWTQLGPIPFGKGIYGCGSDQNWTGYCQRLVTADLDQAQRILDPRQQARVMNRVDTKLAKDVPVIPLYQGPTWAAASKALRGFEPPATPLALFQKAENWWLDD